MLHRYHPKRGLTPRMLSPSRLSLFGVILLGAFPVAAQQAADGWFNQSTMTGDWGGARTTLQDKGQPVQYGNQVVHIRPTQRPSVGTAPQGSGLVVYSTMRFYLP